MSQRRGMVLNQSIAAKIERISTAAIKALRDIGQERPDYVTDARGLDDVLRKQEGVLPRRATLLGPESEDRYKAGPLVHDGKGRFRRGDAKG
jgi:hypothetical protein